MFPTCPRCDGTRGQSRGTLGYKSRHAGLTMAGRRIQDHLLYSLNAHPNNWPTQVQNRALALLRSGEVQTFPALLKQILDEVRKETALEPTKSSKSTDANGSSSSNGADSTTVQVNGGPAGKKTSGGANGTAAGAAGANPGPGEASNLHTNTSTSLAVPRAVVDDALKVTKEVLSTVCEFEEEEENGTT